MFYSHPLIPLHIIKISLGKSKNDYPKIFHRTKVKYHEQQFTLQLTQRREQDKQEADKQDAEIKSFIAFEKT